MCIIRAITFDLLDKLRDDHVDVMAFVNGLGNTFTDFGGLKGWYLLKSMSKVLMIVPMMLIMNLDDIKNESGIQKRLVNANSKNLSNDYFVINGVVFFNHNYLINELDRSEEISDEI